MPIRSCILLRLVSLALLCGAHPALADTFFVTNNNDSGLGSLRAAIEAVPDTGNHDIRFRPETPGPLIISPETNLPFLRGAQLTIDAESQPVVIDGRGQVRLFTAVLGRVVLRGLTIVNGVSANGGCISSGIHALELENVVLQGCRSGTGEAPWTLGGAIYAGTGGLIVKRSVLRNNVAMNGMRDDGRGLGGAIYHEGPLVVEDSIFDGNQAAPSTAGNSGHGGAIFGIKPLTVRRSRFIANVSVGGSAQGGAIYCGNAPCNVESSYFARNSADYAGGAITFFHDNLTLVNNMFVDNRSGSGAAVRVFGAKDTPATLSINNSTFVHRDSSAVGGHLEIRSNTAILRISNTVFGDTADNSAACVSSDPLLIYSGIGYNRTSDAGCMRFLGTESALLREEQLGIVVPVDPRSGEPVRLLPGSALVDAGNPAAGANLTNCVPFDINGTRRPQDGDGDGVSRCDIGAVESRDAFRTDLVLDDPPPATVTAFTLPSVGDALGTQVANVGDVNGDGIDDIGLLATANGGKAWVVYGRQDGFPSELDLTSLSQVDGFSITGLPNITLQRIAAAGDFNRDGRGDVLIGATADAGTPWPGAAYVIYGGTEQHTISVGTPDGVHVTAIDARAGVFGTLGSCVAGLGDINGDGGDDLLIGAASVAPGDAGRAWVAYGPAAPMTMPAVINLSGNGIAGVLVLTTTAPDAIGDSCAAAGDTNNDGLSDLLLGTPQRRHTAGGPVVGGGYLVYGREPGLLNLRLLTAADGRVFTGSGAADGAFLSGGIDISGDGTPDMLVGTWIDNAADQHRAHLVAGGAGSHGVLLDAASPDVLTVLRGASATQALWPPQIVGDIDGDGRADLATGAPLTPTGGRVDVVLSAAAGGTWPPPSFDVESFVTGPVGYRIHASRGPSTARLGSSIAQGDFKADGQGDLVIGAPGSNRAWLVSPPRIADMRADTSRVPAQAVQGRRVRTEVACRNHGSSEARDATCTVFAHPQATVSCRTPMPATLAPGEAIVCDVDFVKGIDDVRIDVGAYSATQDSTASNNAQFALVQDGDDPFGNGFADGFEDD